MFQQSSAAHTKKLLKWIEQYPGWWYLICTPDNGHMTLSIMQTLIEQLHKSGLDELIFVLFMVHRRALFMTNFFSYALLERLIHRWDGDRERIIAGFVAQFQ